MNRQSLARWSLDIPDASFPLALAALGALAALDGDKLGRAYAAGNWKETQLTNVLADALQARGGVLDWVLPDVSREGTPRIAVRGRTGTKKSFVDAPGAAALAAAWRDLMPAASAAPRLAVREPLLPRVAGMLEMVRLLASTEVHAASVYVADAFPSDRRVDWNWPFTIATLPGDPLARPLADRLNKVALNWPFRSATASRETPVAEILVIGAPAANALQRVLASGLGLRSSLVVVTGFGTDAPDVSVPLLRALAARVSAESVAVVEHGASIDVLAGDLNEFADQLTHSVALDVALTQVFGSQSIAFLSDALLHISRLDTAIDRVTARMRALPPETPVQLSPMAIENLQLERIRAPATPTVRALPTGGAKPLLPAPAAIADEIDVARANYRYDKESREASAITELSRRISEAETAARAAEPIARYVHQRTFVTHEGDFVEERGGYFVGRPVLVQIFIGPKREGGIAAQAVFPEEQLPADQATHHLQVVFHEPQQFDRPMLGEIVLPRTGDSTSAEFAFTPKMEGPFEARVSILHRGRVLQTALLRTTVRPATAPAAAASGITMDDETRVRHDWSDLGKRRSFDLAFVLNHVAAGEPSLTGVMGAKAWATRLDGIEQPVRRINELISVVALSVADYADGLDQGENPSLLVKLARVGANLYGQLYDDQLKQLATDGFDIGDESVTHVQVISARPDAVVPLEFMYDFNPPDDTATVCPQHRKALEDGRCPTDCARSTNPQGHVCPMGFWGLKKVIERHLFNPKLVVPQGAEVLVQVEAKEGRNQLDLSAGAVVGHSDQIRPAEIETLLGALNKRLGGTVIKVKDWAEWKIAVGDRHPAILLAFPHNEGKEEDIALEIGGKPLKTLRLPSDYVHAQAFPSPLVFLLGCDVAGTAQDFSSHVGWFRRAGAAVVVSTIATVFGSHAVRVGEAIVARMLEASPTGKLLLGEVIRDAKRDALLKSVPMALCVVAFGDADWRL